VLGVMVHSINPNIYLRFKIAFYKGGIFRMMIDDVATKVHKRFRVSSVAGIEIEDLEKDLDIRVILKNKTNLVIESYKEYYTNAF
jgi:hypothetical protein